MTLLYIILAYSLRGSARKILSQLTPNFNLCLLISKQDFTTHIVFACPQITNIMLTLRKILNSFEIFKDDHAIKATLFHILIMKER